MVNEVQVEAKQLTALVTATVTTRVISPVTIDYEYDPLYRLTSASYSGGETYSYSYDGVGNRLTMVYPGGTVNYTYDAANRLTAVGGQSYTWDENGNLLSDGVRTYQYDHANRLKQVTEGSLTTQFAYNGDGVRVGKNVGAATTDYLVDLAATLPVVISDTHAIYLYGLDIIAEQLAGADRYYYVHDGLGSVRQLLDTTGQIEAKYTYDPFGVPLSGDGVPNPWQFTGEAWDAGVELLYLRARYYQPETGRFVTKDPWPGNVWSPGTLNGYLYVVNSPISRLDPSGLQQPIRVTPDAGPTAEGQQAQPSAASWSHPIPSSTPTAGDIRWGVVHELSSLYGINLHHMYWGYEYLSAVGSLWETWQLDLVREAAGDFARRVEGGSAGLKSRIAPVFLCKTEEELLLSGEPQRAYAWFGHIVAFAGELAFWRDMPAQKWTVVHELAHVWDIKSGFRLSLGMVATGRWAATVRIDCDVPRSVEVRISDVRVREWRQGKSTKHLNPLEDWAEAVAAYVYNAYADIKNWEVSEGRWYYVAQELNPSNSERYAYPDEWRGIPFGEADVSLGR